MLTSAARTFRRLLYPTLILLVGVAATWFAAKTQEESSDRRARSEFERRVNRLNVSFSERFGRMDTLLRGGRGLWLASEDVSVTEWNHFLEGVGWNHEFPELRSFGFIELPRGAHSRSASGATVRLVEPSTVRRATVWHRALAEPMFRDAMDRAAKSGHLVVLPVDTLFREGELGDLMLMLPVRSKHGDNTTELDGFVFLSFNADEVLTSVLETSEVPVRLRVATGETWHVGDLVTMSKLPPIGPVPIESTQNQLSIEYFARPQGELQPLLTIWGVGLFISACLAMLIDSLAYTREIANQLAQKMTKELRVEQVQSSRLAKVAQQTHNPVFMVDEAGTVGWMNLAAERTCHLSRSSRVESIFELFADADLRDTVETALREGKPFAFQTEVDCGDTVRVLDLTASPVRSDDGASYGSVIVAYDVTEHFARQTALDQARLEAERTSRLKSEFLASVSHEIRTPMNGIIGMAQLLTDDLPDGRDRDTAATILSCGQALLGILNDVLDFSKIESGHLELEATEFDLRNLIEETLANFGTVCRQKPIHLLPEIDLPSPSLVTGDSLRVRQVLGNLVSNAVKFTTDGYVRVRVDLIDGGIRIQVEDTGVGIPESIRDQILQPFRQADGSTTRRFGGTGLGLSICCLLVQRMAGRLWFESTVGEGSSFFVELPLSVATHPVEAADHRERNDVPLLYRRGLDLALQAAGLPDAERDGAIPVMEGDQVVSWRIADHEFSHPLRVSQVARALLPITEPSHPIEAQFSGRVLLVDDNTVNLKVGARLLERCGCVVTLAQSGLEALEILGRERFDMVFMDIEMPDLDGVEVVRVFRAREAERGWGRVPIIALTARALGPDEAVCREVGMDDYITKPVVAERLRQIMREHGLTEVAA